MSGTWGAMAVPCAAAAVLCLSLAVRLLRSRRHEAVKRGVRLVARAPARRRRERHPTPGRVLGESLRVGGVAIAPLDECKHFKFVGTTGTGKSTAIRELLSGAIRRGDRAIFADPDGGYCARFFDRYRGDVVLNPFERGSRRWDWSAEIKNNYDVDQLASGLVPASNDASGQEWRGYARTFLAAVLRRCHERALCDSHELWRLLSVASADELRPLVASTPAQPFLDPDNARMFGSIRSVLGSAVAPFEYIRTQRAAPFSVRQWVRDSAVPSMLFIPYRAGQIAALRSMIAAWLRLAIVEALSGIEDQDQRLWFVVDELDALGTIDGLKDALARLRKFGGRCVLGLQSVAQVSSTYGGDSQTIIENCGNTLILRCSGSEDGGTAQFASKLIGEREIIRRQIARGRDRDGAFLRHGARRSTNVSEQHVMEAAVLPSELEQLPDLCGYFKAASSPVWRKIVLSRGAQ